MRNLQTWEVRSGFTNPGGCSCRQLPQCDYAGRRSVCQADKEANYRKKLGIIEYGWWLVWQLNKKSQCNQGQDTDRTLKPEGMSFDAQENYQHAI